jgi:putative ABC transport system permease protein
VTSVGRLAGIGLVRAPFQTVIRIVVLALAAALLGAMILFVGQSLRTMTSSAVRSVPLDWQGAVGTGAAARRVATETARQPGVIQATAVGTAPFAGAAHATSLGVVRSGGGALLAVGPGYLDHIKTFRFLRGSLEPGGVVLDQQLAATLQARVGDTIRMTPRAGSAPMPLRVTGVALVTAADVLFQPLNPLVGPAPAQPPANVAVMPLDTFAAKIAPVLPARVPSSPTAAALPGVPTGVQWQVQAQIDPQALSGSPSRALRQADRTRNRVERTLTGQIQYVDNLSAALTTAAGDALYAETLFIMLAVPGALVALGLAYLAALGTATRDRRDLALLRARGASRADLFGLAATESAMLGLLAGILGTGLALLALDVAVPHAGFSGWGRPLAALGVCVGVAFTGALAARLGASASVFRETVTAGRRSVRRASKPMWQRLWLDVACLVGSGLVYWLTVSTGFSAVVNPDSNPTLSLSAYMFLAPLLLWVGATLLLVRLRGRVLGAVVLRFAGRRATTRSGYLLASAGRRGGAINRGLVVVGLLLAFGVSLGIFSATFDQQSRVDAQLTLGADVVVTAPGDVRSHVAPIVARVSGVTGATAVNHTYAYVGPDLQDTFGIDAATFTNGSTLRDSYFLGAGARRTLDRLRSRPDGILVSKETISDYSLRLGDLLRLRVLDAALGRFRIVPFHVAGIVQEFPSAPRDSFMVANLAYLDRVTHTSPHVLFVGTRGSPSAVGRAIAAATAAHGTTVKDIRAQNAQTASSITAVDLSGISRIEEIFAVVLAAAAIGLYVGIAVAERRTELATMAAVGATLRDIVAFVWSEAALVLAGSFVLAAFLGWLLAEMLVAMLSHVFDPPPDHLAVPWLFLAVLGAAALIGAVASVALAARTVGRLPLGAILREE